MRRLLVMSLARSTHSLNLRGTVLFKLFCGVVVCTAQIGSSAYAGDPASVDELLELSPSQRRNIDPTKLNVLGARGLPGEETINLDQCTATLEQWTNLVRVETEKQLATLDRHDLSLKPSPTGSNESRSEAQVLIQVLHDLFGPNAELASVRGGTLEAAVSTGAPLDPRDLFLCGMLESINPSHRPTVVSLPWLYLAVGRQLGYPLRLAAQNGHLILRWESQDEHFTIDWQRFWAQPPIGGPELRFRVEHPVSQTQSSPSEQPQLPTPMNLLSADDELAMLLNARGACLESHGQNTEALVAYAQAHQLSPDCDNYVVAIAHVMPKISSLYGHTEPVAAPDYSDRGGPLEEVNALNRINLQRQQDDEARLRQVMEENQRALKARQNPSNNRP